MKKTKILYWVFTILFAGIMCVTAIPDVLMDPEAVTFMNGLGYRNYFLPFIGVAKILGVIAILIPGFPRIKEWAYAGLFFDLFGATYSVIAVHGIDPGMVAFMLPMFVLCFLSYGFHHKLINISKAALK